MFCKNCGRQLLPNEKFCADCGAPVPVQESAVQNEQPIAENQSVEQTADMNVRNEQTQPVENHQTDAYNQMPANDYSAPQYQTVNALVVAIAAFFIFNGLNKNTPQGQIQGTWIAEENGVSLQLEFKPDGTIGIPNAKELGELISNYVGSSEYSDMINYDEIFNLIDMKYSIDDEKTLSISVEVSFVNQSQSQSLKWSDDPANGGSDTWGIDGDTLYIAGTKLTRINN